MRKYFTRRCIGLHLLLVVLVPSFLVAGWWQYTVAMGGNALSWVYTFEWPFLAVYAVYAWWKMIHDRTTFFDKLWAAKQRAAADASGRPLHEIPGWAMDKQLSQEVVRTSLEAARLHALAQSRPDALGLAGHETLLTIDSQSLEGVWPELTEVTATPKARPTPISPDEAVQTVGDQGRTVIDARVLEVRSVVDEELDAYNRYLAELSFRDPPKRWHAPRRTS